MTIKGRRIETPETPRRFPGEGGFFCGRRFRKGGTLISSILQRSDSERR